MASDLSNLIFHDETAAREWLYQRLLGLTDVRPIAHSN